jgi:hypothetical protein
MLYDKAISKKDALAALSVLNSLYGWRPDSKKGDVNVAVDVKVNNVMVVTDHGTDDQWAAKAAEQQRALAMDAANTPKTITMEAAPALPESDAAWVPPSQPAVPTWVSPAQVAAAATPSKPSGAVEWKRNS